MKPAQMMHKVLAIKIVGRVAPPVDDTERTFLILQGYEPAKIGDHWVKYERVSK